MVVLAAPSFWVKLGRAANMAWIARSPHGAPGIPATSHVVVVSSSDTGRSRSTPCTADCRAPPRSESSARVAATPAELWIARQLPGQSGEPARCSVVPVSSSETGRLPGRHKEKDESVTSSSRRLVHVGTMAAGQWLAVAWSIASGVTGQVGVAAHAPVVVASALAIGTSPNRLRAEAADAKQSTRRRSALATRTAAQRLPAAMEPGASGRSGHPALPPAPEAYDTVIDEWSTRPMNAADLLKGSRGMWLLATRMCRVPGTSTASLIPGLSGVHVPGLVMASSDALAGLQYMAGAGVSGVLVPPRRLRHVPQAQGPLRPSLASLCMRETASSASGLPGASAMSHVVVANPCASGA